MRRIESSRVSTETEFGKVYAAIESSRVSTETEFGKVYAAIESSRVSTETEFGKVYAAIEASAGRDGDRIRQGVHGDRSVAGVDRV